MAISQQTLEQYRQLKEMLKDPEVDVARAAACLGVTVQKAHFILARGAVTKAQLKQRRKDYIVHVMTGKVAHRHTPHVIGAYFKVDESHIVQLIKELRDEGRLPAAPDGGFEWQEEILKVLRRKYPNVYRARTVGKQDKVGDKVYVAGKGWLSWQECHSLAYGGNMKPRAA